MNSIPLPINYWMQQSSSSTMLPNEAAEHETTVSIEELVELRACKRKLKEIRPKYWAALHQLEETEAELERLQEIVANGLQFQPNAKIRLSLPDFTKFVNKKAHSRPVEMVGFEWKLQARHRPNSDWLELFLFAIPPAQYKGPYEFVVDVSFRVFNALSTEDVTKEFKAVEFNKGPGCAASCGGNMIKLKKLLDQNNGFLQGNGPVQVAVEFTVNSATFEHISGLMKMGTNSNEYCD